MYMLKCELNKVVFSYATKMQNHNNSYVNDGVDLHDETESEYKSSNPQNEDEIFNFGTREIYKITDMSTQSVHIENNEAVSMIKIIILL